MKPRLSHQWDGSQTATVAKLEVLLAENARLKDLNASLTSTVSTLRLELKELRLSAIPTKQDDPTAADLSGGTPRKGSEQFDISDRTRQLVNDSLAAALALVDGYAGKGANVSENANKRALIALSLAQNEQRHCAEMQLAYDQAVQQMSEIPLDTVLPSAERSSTPTEDSAE